MRHDSLYQVGGNAVLLGALLFGAAILLHAPQPMDLAAFGAVPMGPWMASHWLLVISAVLMAGGLVAFTRHLSRTEGEGWSVLGLGANIVTSGLVVAIVAPEIAGFDALRAMNASGDNVGAQHAYLAINVGLLSLVHVVGPLFWIGGACYALAMLRDASWPRWVGRAGLAIALVEIAANWALASNWTLQKLVMLVGYVWLAIAGFLFSRFVSRGTPAHAGVAAPRGAYQSGEGVASR